MWFHPLDALKQNQISAEQVRLGWDDEERKDLMMYFYQHIVRAHRKAKRFIIPGQLTLAGVL